MYNPYSLEGKTILITGASSGIGKATAIECSRLGAKCVITGRNAERLNETFCQLEGDGHIQVITDLSTQEGIDAIVEASPIIDGLVNNAGQGYNRPISFYRRSDLETVFSTNTFAPMLLTKDLYKQKKIAKGGSIVFIASIAVRETAFGNGIYGASKGAIDTFMRYCAQEFSMKKIRANAVLPGMVETKLIHRGVYSEEDLQKAMDEYPLKRYGTPEEVAWAIIYLLSDASAWVTGSSLLIDGGKMLVK